MKCYYCAEEVLEYNLEDDQGNRCCLDCYEHYREDHPLYDEEDTRQ